MHSTDERRVFPTPSHGVEFQGTEAVSTVYRVTEATVSPMEAPAYAWDGWQCNASAVLMGLFDRSKATEPYKDVVGRFKRCQISISC